MENASKALIMAGGILIALIIIAVLIRAFSSVSSFQKAKLTEEEQAQLVAFNEQYTKYLNQYVYGSEVITVVNKSLNRPEYKIDTKILFNVGYTYKTYEYVNGTKQEKINTVKAGSALNITNKGGKTDNIAYDIIVNPAKEDDSLINRAFKCTKIGYDSFGRVNSIVFEEKEWGDLT